MICSVYTNITGGFSSNERRLPGAFHVGLLGVAGRIFSMLLWIIPPFATWNTSVTWRQGNGDGLFGAAAAAAGCAGHPGDRWASPGGQGRNENGGRSYGPCYIVNMFKYQYNYVISCGFMCFTIWRVFVSWFVWHIVDITNIIATLDGMSPVLILIWVDMI